MNFTGIKNGTTFVFNYSVDSGPVVELSSRLNYVCYVCSRHLDTRSNKTTLIWEE